MTPGDEGQPLDLDLDLDLAATEQPRDKPLVAEKKFNAERWHEYVRTGVALAIIAAVIVDTLVLLIAFVDKGITAPALSAATAAIVTPLVGIAGTVLGFYFGTHRRADNAGG